MSDTPKFLSKQELELQEVNYIFSLRAERDELQEQLNTAKKLLTALAHAECHTCGEEFEDNNCEFYSFAYPFCSQECYDNYMKNEGSDDERY